MKSVLICFWVHQSQSTILLARWFCYGFDWEFRFYLPLENRFALKLWLEGYFMIGVDLCLDTFWTYQRTEPFFYSRWCLDECFPYLRLQYRSFLLISLYIYLKYLNSNLKYNNNSVNFRCRYLKLINLRIESNEIHNKQAIIIKFAPQE